MYLYCLTKHAYIYIYIYIYTHTHIFGHLVWCDGYPGKLINHYT